MTQLFRIPAFRDLWVGGAISRFGDALYFIGFPFMVGEVTGDPTMVAYVGAVEALPYLLLGPYAGALADRVDRRRIMVVSDVVSTVLLLLFAAVVALLGAPPVWSFFLFGFGLSASRVFFMPAKNAAVPNVVPPEMLMKANAFSMGTDQAIWLASLAVSTTVLATLYKLSPLAFYLAFIVVNTLSFLGSAVFVRRLPEIRPDRVELHAPLREIRDGLAYVRTQRTILVSLISQFGLSLFMSPFFTVYIATNKQWFGGLPSTLGWIEIAFVSGMLLVSLVVMKFRLKRVGWAWSLGLGVAGLLVIAMGFSRQLEVFIFWNVLCGLAIGFVDVPMTSYVQMTVPDELRGRVMSLKNLIMMGTMPIGMVAGGQLLKNTSIGTMYMIMGAGFAASGFACLLSRGFREARIPDGPPPPADPDETSNVPSSPPIHVPVNSGS